jgi:hypothetical protein
VRRERRKSSRGGWCVVSVRVVHVQHSGGEGLGARLLVFDLRVVAVALVLGGDNVVEAHGTRRREDLPSNQQNDTAEGAHGESTAPAHGRRTATEQLLLLLWSCNVVLLCCRGQGG